MIRRKLAALTLALTLPFTGSVLSEQPATAVVNINGETITPQVFQIIYKSIKKQDFTATPKATLNRLIENRLLALHSKDQNIQEPESKVGFQRPTSINDQLVGLLRSTFKAPYSQWQARQQHGLNGFISYQNTLTPTELKTLLGNTSFIYELPEAQLDALENTTLALYSFPNEAEQTITLKDIYQRQNVQGRISLHQGDRKYLSKQVLQMLDRRSVIYWARHYSGLSREDLISLKQILGDQRQRKVVMKSLGLGDFYHGNNPIFDELVKQVSQQEILAYYIRNKSMFRTIESAHVQAIYRSSQEDADKTYDQLNQLASKQLLTFFQKSGSKSEQVSRSSDHPIWLTGLAFAQSINRVSKPVRLPSLKGVKPSWAIVLVTEKEESTLKPDSETVRYEASRNIARRKANENFYTLLADLRNKYPVSQSLKAIKL